MPPEGYSTVTLPDDLLDRLDDHARAMGAESRADALAALLDGQDTRVSAHLVAADDDVLDDVAVRTAHAVVEELEHTAPRR